MDFKLWLEATRDYVKKITDPALYTQEEYYTLINSSGKFHSSDAYRFSIQDLEKDHYTANYGKKSHPILLKTIKLNGVYFEFRLKKEDKLDNKYVKVREDGEVVRDEKGMALYYDRDELEKILEASGKRYEYMIGVFTEEDGWIGGSQDEWGAMLIHIADEYRGFGLGPILGKMARELEPEKTSGGMTPAGYSNFQRVHREFVSDYLTSGMYSHLVKTGQITAERAKAIINSSTKNKKYNQRNLNTSNASDWLVYSDNGSIIIYDKKLKDVIKDEDAFWKNKMIKGMVLIRIHHDYTRIILLGGESDKIKSYLMTMAAVEAKHNKTQLVVEPEDVPFIDRSQIEVGDLGVTAGPRSHLVNFKGKPFDTNLLGQKEKLFRKSFDQYDEFQWEMVGMAEAKYRK